MYKEKGITLIALIITIIIMLILVIVTVQIATNGGLIDKAHEASDKTKAEAANEANKMATASDEIDDILNPPTDETLFTFDETNGEITGYTGDLASIIIPRKIGGIPVTSIDTSAFYDNTILTSVIIPNSVTKIDAIAFSGCTSLENVIIPSSVTTIGDRAFSNTAFLNNLLAANDGIAISNNILLNVSSIKEGTSLVIPEGVKMIADYALQDCNDFISISLPDSLVNIGRAAFISCYALTSIELRNNVNTIGQQAFKNCSSLDEVTILNTGNITIGSDVFYGCTNSILIRIAKATDSITGAPWGAPSGYTITWNYTPE